MSKERNITETPDKWVVLELNNGGYLSSKPEPLYRVFGSWAGGYLDGDMWKTNSGIASLEEDDDYYYFMGYSGSTYKCHKKCYGVMTSYSQGILDNMIEKGSISVLLDETNFMELLNQNKEDERRNNTRG